MLETKVLSATQASNGTYTVTVEPAKGGGTPAQQKLDTDAILVCIGRRPYTERLGLKEVGVETDEKGRIKINSQFVTNIPSIRAIGDVVAGAMLAHKAEEEGNLFTG
jgi:dihydrolipoamide dehydrogenase